MTGWKPCVFATLLVAFGLGAVPNAAQTAPDRLLLPDLVPLESTLYERYVSHENGRLLLRFPNTVVNQGDGPAEVNGVRRGNRMIAYQVLYKSKGRRGRRVPIGEFEWHAAHKHWHLMEVAQYSLLNAAGEVVTNGGKFSYCLADTDRVLPDLPGNPRRPRYIDCSRNPRAKKLRSGVSIGWGDTYPAHIDGQSLDITDLPPGRYRLRSQVNPAGTIQEKTTDNNTVEIFVDL